LLLHQIEEFFGNHTVDSFGSPKFRSKRRTFRATNCKNIPISQNLTLNKLSTNLQEELFRTSKFPIWGYSHSAERKDQQVKLPTKNKSLLNQSRSHYPSCDVISPTFCEKKNGFIRPNAQILTKRSITIFCWCISVQIYLTIWELNG